MASDTGGHQTYYVPEQSKYPFLATIGLGMFILGAVRLATEKVVDFRTRHHQRSAAIVTQSLQPHVPGSAGSAT